MAKAQNTNSLVKKYLTGKNISIAAGVLLALYLIALFNPLTGPWLQYPYYKIGCGRDPVVTHSIMGKRYYSPDMEKYRENIRGASAIFCTEREAIEAGFHRSTDR